MAKVVHIETFSVIPGKEKECEELANEVLQYFREKISEANKMILAPLNGDRDEWLVVEHWETEAIMNTRTATKLADPEWERIIGDFFRKGIVSGDRSALVHTYHRPISPL